MKTIKKISKAVYGNKRAAIFSSVHESTVIKESAGFISVSLRSTALRKSTTNPPLREVNRNAD